ncbi:hypothetical protein AgCh_027197 [Apium graveolens]
MEHGYTKRIKIQGETFHMNPVAIEVEDLGGFKPGRYRVEFEEDVDEVEEVDDEVKVDVEVYSVVGCLAKAWDAADVTDDLKQSQ